MAAARSRTLRGTTYEVVVANLFDGDARRVGERIGCYALFTDPTLGRVGLSETEARSRGYSLLRAKMPMQRVGRAREAGETQGFMKVVVDAESRRILGAAILGLSGDEVVQTLLNVMAAGAPYTASSRTMQVPPTVSGVLYLREDVLNALGLKEAPRWYQHLFARTQRTTAVWTDSEERTSRYCVISESGFYKLLCLGRLNDVGLTFNHEGGNLIYNMPGPGEGFDTEQREFFRNLLRSLHSNWLRYDAPADDLDQWDMPA